MRRKTIKRLLFIGRLIPLLIAFCAIGTWAVWTFVPELVTRVDDKVIRMYVRDNSRLLNNALALLNKDRAAGIAALERVTGEFESYRRGDRLFTFAKQGLLALGRAHARNQDYKAAAAVLERTLRIDDKDLHARADYLSYQSKIPASRAAAIAGLRKWHGQFPVFPRFAEQLATLLAEDGAIGAAWTVQNATFERLRSNSWRLGWERAVPQKKHRAMSVHIIPRLADGKLRLTFEAEPAATQFEIRVPAFSYLEFREFVMTGERLDGRSWPISAEFKGTTLEDGVRRITSASASIWVFDLQGMRQRFELAAGEPITVHIETDVTALPSPQMSWFAFKHRDKLAALANERRDAAMAAQVRAWAASALSNESMQLYWHSKDNTFARERSIVTRIGGGIRGDRQVFSHRFEVGQALASVRFDMPPRQGAKWRLTRILVETKAQPIELVSPKPTTRVDLDEEPGDAKAPVWYVVNGADPYLVYPLAKEVHATHVTIEGEIR